MSDHIEHTCAKCGSYLHHASKCTVYGMCAFCGFEHRTSSWDERTAGPECANELREGYDKGRVAYDSMKEVVDRYQEVVLRAFERVGDILPADDLAQALHERLAVLLDVLIEERAEAHRRLLDEQALNAELMARWFRTFDLLPEGRVDAALARADALLANKPDPTPSEPPCGVCLGTGKPLSKLPCICGGSGLQGDEVIGLRRALYKATTPTSTAMRDPIARLLRERIVYMGPDEVMWRRQDGASVSAKDALAILDDWTPDAAAFIEDVYDAAIQMLQVDVESREQRTKGDRT